MTFVALGAVPAVEQFREQLKSATERTDGEKMILLKLRHGNDLAKECVLIAHRLGWTPCKHDWRTLFACGLIVREATRGFIVLTSLGLMWQERLAHAMARIAGMHAMLPHDSDRFNVTARCTCGWTATLSKNQGRVISGQFTHFGVHLDAVRKGIWRKPRSVDEIVAETIARQTAPIVPALPADASDIDAASEVYVDGEDIETSYDLLEEEAHR
jgi:hypothetical protein